MQVFLTIQKKVITNFEITYWAIKRSKLKKVF